MSWSARCDCRNGHNSSSGRCNNRDITDPTRKDGEGAFCANCRTTCPDHRHAEVPGTAGRGIALGAAGVKYGRDHWTVTYLQQGSAPCVAARTLDWTDVLSAQHSWIFEGVQTH